MEKYFSYINSPIGILSLTATDSKLISIEFETENLKLEENNNSFLDLCKKELEEYFEGKRKIFSLDVELNGTEFQKSVWLELIKIPFGSTINYLELSKKISDEKAIRAVANANSKNVLPIIVPCHRVIGSNGNLVGYAGGLWRKKWLIEHEQNFSQTVKQLKFF
ncbi:MAG: methylated-DNA--[protein]-cysteine S-methyltransferase [Ignavibacteria bacterium]|nr:methylated-DNA--[protein]-cysteine S-methyltransferase [Ignavibacteria bacterium]